MKIANWKSFLFLVPALALVPGGCKPRPVTPGGLPRLHNGMAIVRVLLTTEPIDSVPFAAGRIIADGKTVFERHGAPGALAVRRAGGLWHVGDVAFKAEEVVIVPDDGRLSFGHIAYRGELHLRARGDKFIVVNHVEMESYLAGVLARELYPGWHIEAYRAQALVARTFAVYHILTSGMGRDYDLGDTTASQVYGGMSAETDKVWRAVDSTCGQVLAAEQDGEWRIFMAQYSSCCGGWVNGAIVLRDAPDLAPLRGGQRCEHCGASSKYRWPAVRVDKEELYEALVSRYPQLRTLGRLGTIRTVAELPHGRAVWVDIVGPAGRSIRIRAEGIRLALLFGGHAAGRKLYSMNCRIVDGCRWIEFRDGRGYGHGVGMCQFGAEGKARAGWSGERIVEFYYPGAKIIRAYSPVGDRR